MHPFTTAHFSEMHTFFRKTLESYNFKMSSVICDKSDSVTSHKCSYKTYEIVSFGHLIGQIENFNLLLLKFTAHKFSPVLLPV